MIYNAKTATEYVEFDFIYHGDYHTIDSYDLQEAIDKLDKNDEFNTASDMLDHMRDKGFISECADSSTPIYYSDIAKWFGENYRAVDEYVSEIGAPESKDFDIMKLIQGAFYISYERDLSNAIELLLKEMTLAESDTKESQALVGTYASHVRNMLEGVTKGFTKKLLVEGVGYKWDVQGKTVNLALGFSHPVKVEIPEGLTVKAEKSTLIIEGSNKEAVGQFAANIRALKKPEPYKGKGIRYDGEVIRRKQGKKAA